MPVEMTVEELERKLREKERTIASRLQRIVPGARVRARRGHALGSQATAPTDPAIGLTLTPRAREVLLLVGSTLVVLGLPSELRPRRVEARLRPNRWGQLAFVTGLTIIAFSWGRRLGQRAANIADAGTLAKAPPSAGAPR